MSASTQDLLDGAGEVGALARTFEWASTPLGPVNGWPGHVRTAVDLCLSSKLPMMVCWGADLVQIYNDAFSDLLGRRHPAAFGQGTKECWSGEWGILEPLYDEVASTGDAVLAEDLLLLADRRGFVEESYLTLALGPIRDPTGDVPGVHVAAIETTPRVLQARRLRMVTELTARIAGRRTAVDACAVAAEALSSCGLDIPYALIYLRDPATESLHLVGCTGMDAGRRLSPERVRPARGNREANPWRLGEEHTPGGHVVRVQELGTMEEDLPPNAWGLRHEQALVLPMVATRHHAPLGFLVAGLSPVCALDVDYKAFLSLVADAVASAAVGAARDQRLRRRIEALTAEVELRSRFIAGVSHEMRTPLNAIVAHSELLREGYVGELTKQQALQVGHVGMAAKSLLALVDEVLEFAQMEVGVADLHLRETDLGDLVEEVAEFLDPLFRERGLDFRVRVPTSLEPVKTDPAKLRQILINLLSNAHKYTDAGSIELAVTQEPKGAISVSVTDTGVGIAPRDQARVFEPFSRLPGSSERSGSGLGLTVSRSLARLLGGDLYLNSEPGVGSTFTLRIPGQVEPDNADARPPLG